MKRWGDDNGVVLAVGGLASEARIAAGSGVRALAGGGDNAALAAAIDDEIGRGVLALISFGIAGALDPSFAAGTLVVARSVMPADGPPLHTDSRWSAALLRCLPGAISGDLAGSDTIASSPALKAALRERTGAVAVDMESHVVGKAALRHGVPFVALRAIADPAHRQVPPAAIVAMRPGGGIDLAAVLASLLRSPAQIGGLCRLGADSRRALRALVDGRARLGRGLGHADLDELALHVV